MPLLSVWLNSGNLFLKQNINSAGTKLSFAIEMDLYKFLVAFTIRASFPCIALVANNLSVNSEHLFNYWTTEAA